jgi:spore maturation protein CgeB
MINWHLRQHRPARLEEFSRHVLDLCRIHRPAWLLATGLAPLTAEAIDEIRALGAACLNYLTDDPWNPHHRTPWFLRALPRYDRVFSPRQANLADLRAASCPAVAYLPFAYHPELHRPEEPGGEEEHRRLACDVLFVGGSDSDRLPWITRLISAGLDVALYGGYWERDRATRQYSRGHADPATVRKATAAAKVALCLVRQANRDGHVMRTFEIAAMRGCMLAEDTAEHRQLLGEEGEAVLYFNSPDEMVVKARWLLDNPEERRRLAGALYQRVTGGCNTYRDRLKTMLSLGDQCKIAGAHL